MISSCCGAAGGIDNDATIVTEGYASNTTGGLDELPAGAFANEGSLLEYAATGELNSPAVWRLQQQ